MADAHTLVERKLKQDINAKNKMRRDLEKSMSLIRQLNEKKRKCKNHRNISSYNSTIKRHRKKVEQLRGELLQKNEDLEKRIRKEMEYSEKEVEEFKIQLEKEIREMEEAGSKLERIKTVQDKLNNTEEFLNLLERTTLKSLKKIYFLLIR